MGSGYFKTVKEPLGLMKEVNQKPTVIWHFQKKFESHNYTVSDFFITMVINYDTRFHTLDGFGAVSYTYLPFHAIYYLLSTSSDLSSWGN